LTVRFKLITTDSADKTKSRKLGGASFRASQLKLAENVYSMK